MEKAFKKSRQAVIKSLLAGLALGVLAVFYMYRVREAGILRALLPFPVVLLVSFFIGRYLARLLAVREYQTVMALLYEGLRAEEFVQTVETLLKNPMEPVAKTTTLAHLANGYAALGRFEDAHRILEQTDLPDEAVALRGLLLNNLVACLLLEGRQQEAKRRQAELRALLADERCKEDFRKKAQSSLAYQDICLNIYKGRASDLAALERDFQSSRNELHRLEVKWYLAIAYRQKGDRERFTAARDYVLQKSGTALHYGKTLSGLDAGDGA